jgi:hypothetical protein
VSLLKGHERLYYQEGIMLRVVTTDALMKLPREACPPPNSWNAADFWVA